MTELLHLLKKFITSLGSNFPWWLMSNTIFHLKLEKETWGFLRLAVAPETKKQMGTIYSEAPARLTLSYSIWRNSTTYSTGGKERKICFICIQEPICICSSACLALCLLTQACYLYFSDFVCFQVIPSRNTHFLSMRHFCTVRLCFSLCCTRAQISALGESSAQVSSCNCCTSAFILLVLLCCVL